MSILRLKKNNTVCHPTKSFPRLLNTAVMLISLGTAYQAKAACTSTVTGLLNTTCNLGLGESVTVTNTGSINASPNAIQINNVAAGSVINNGSIFGSNAALNVEFSGGLQNGVSNSGVMSGNWGVHVSDNADVAGGVNNTNTIIGNYAGIGVYQAGDISGIITNNGLVAGNQAAIDVAFDGDISGTIVNNNQIAGGWLGIGVTDSGDISGGIQNNAILTANYAALGVYNLGDVSGGLNNSGTVSGNHAGVNVDFNSDISGGIQNSGQISGDWGVNVGYNSNISGGITNATSGNIAGHYAGVGVYSGSDISGGINNSGNISGNHAGVDVAFNSTVNGIKNSGNIQGMWGVDVGYNSDITAPIINDGVIEGSYAGIGVYANSDVSGGITNNFYIGGNYIGVDVSGGAVTGGINNVGTIFGGVAAIDANLARAPIIINNSGVLNGNVHLGSSTLNLNGGTLINGNVDGTAGSSVNVTAHTGNAYSDVTFSGLDNFNINSGADISFNGVDTQNGVKNDGTLSIATGKFTTVNGDYTQQTNGVLQVGAYSTSSYGQLYVTNNADFSASGNINVLVDAGATLVNNSVLQNVVTVGGTLTTGTLTATDNSFLFDFTAVNDGANGIDLNTTMVNSVSATTANDETSAGAAKTLDTLYNSHDQGKLGAALTHIASLDSAKKVSDTVAQLTPVMAGAGSQSAMTSARALADVVNSSSGIAQNGASSGDNTLPARFVWFKPFTSWADQDKRNSVPGYDSDQNGFAVGIDQQTASAWRLGVAASGSRSNIDSKSNVAGQSLDIDNYQLMIYGGKENQNDSYVNTHLSAGLNKNDSKRQVMGGVARADFDSWYGQFGGEFGKHYNVSEQLIFSPSINGDYIYVKEESYNEKGAPLGLNLNVGSKKDDSLILGVDGKLTYDTLSAVALTGHAGVGYDVLAHRSEIASTFDGGGPVFITRGAKADPVVARAGVGVILTDAKPLNISVNYETQAREDFLNQEVEATVKYSF